MTLTDGDEVVGMQLDTQGKYLLTVSEKGMGKLHRPQRVYRADPRR